MATPPPGAPPAAPPAGAPPAAANTINVPGIGPVTQQPDGTFKAANGLIFVSNGHGGITPDPTSLALVTAVVKGQSQPGGLPAGSYSVNPDGTLTVTDPKIAPPGTTVAKNGAFMNPDGTPYSSSTDGSNTPRWATRTPSGDPATDNPNFKGDNGGIVNDLITKDNPIAGTFNAGVDLTHGQYKKAASDFGAGASGGTLPQVDPNGNIVPGDTTKTVATDAGVPPNVPGVTSPVTGPGGIGDQLKGLLDGIGDGGGGGGGTGAPAPDTNPGDDFRRQQLAYADQLQATINGTAGPSAADIQGHNSQDRAIAQQFAAAQGATGANSGLAYRQALQNAAGISQQAGADAATLRAKEIQDAQGQYNTLLSQGRGGDLTKYNTDVGAGNVRYAADKDFQGKKIAAAAGVLSGGIGAIVSDERKKTAIAPADDEIAAMLDKLKAHKFQYKDPAAAGAAPGKRAGVMAQDLEKSMAGKALVIEAPDGTKGIDSPQAVGAMLAALASLHARTKRLEGRG